MMVRKKQTLSVYWARLVHSLLTREGLDADRLFSEAGLNAADLNNPAAQFAQDGFTVLWKTVVIQTQNPAFGLKMGEVPTLTAFDAYSLAQISSANVRDAVERGMRYHKIVGSAFTMAIEQHRDGLQITFSSMGDTLAPATEGFDAGLALTIGSLRLTTSQQIIPQYVEFAFAQPDDIKPYEDFFQCPVRFGCSTYSLFLDNDNLNTSMSFADQDLARWHDGTLRQTIGQGPDATLPDRLKAYIARQLPSGEPPLADAAKSLGMSVRTVQRKLHQMQSGFRQLIDETRMELAKDYINHTDIPLQEITFLLGFTDHANFYRAFNRWFGKPPGALRRR